MAYGVFHQCQQRHRRALQLQHAGIRVHRKHQAIRHPHVHDFEIGAHQLELLPQRRRRFMQARHGGTQVSDQALQYFGSLGGAGFHQRLHIGERVEKKVRLDLRLQQPEARIQRFAFQLAALQGEGGGLIAGESIALPDKRAHGDPGTKQDACKHQREIALNSGWLGCKIRVAAGGEPIREKRG